MIRTVAAVINYDKTDDDESDTHIVLTPIFSLHSFLPTAPFVRVLVRRSRFCVEPDFMLNDDLAGSDAEVRIRSNCQVCFPFCSWSEERLI